MLLGKPRTTIIRLLASDHQSDADMLFECERCGTTVEHREMPCPYCDESRIVEFEL